MNKDELIEGLEYISGSPAPEWGGFHPKTVAIAKAALALIRPTPEPPRQAGGESDEQAFNAWYPTAPSPTPYDAFLFALQMRDKQNADLIKSLGFDKALRIILSRCNP